MLFEPTTVLLEALDNWFAISLRECQYIIQYVLVHDSATVAKYQTMTIHTEIT